MPSDGTLVSLSDEVWRRLTHEAGHAVAAEWYSVRWRLVGPSEVALPHTDLAQVGALATAAIALAGPLAEARTDVQPRTLKAARSRMSIEDEALTLACTEDLLPCAVADANAILDAKWSRVLDLVTTWASAMVSGDFKPAQGRPEGYTEG